MATFAFGGCSATTYKSNLAFDITQQAYATDRTAEAVVVSHVDDGPQGPCPGLIVC